MKITPKLFGLVLAGGASTRMGKDKALENYRGRPHADWTFELLASRCAEVYLSARFEQLEDTLRSSRPHIVDTHTHIGPAAGLLAAHTAHPAAAWLVVACDLAYLDAATIDRLIEQRDPALDATAYRDPSDGLAQPFLTIWEPSGLEQLSQAVERGELSPRAVLGGLDANFLQASNEQALINVNTPAERAAAKRDLEQQS